MSIFTAIMEIRSEIMSNGPKQISQVCTEYSIYFSKAIFLFNTAEATSQGVCLWIPIYLLVYRHFLHTALHESSEKQQKKALMNKYLDIDSVTRIFPILSIYYCILEYRSKTFKKNILGTSDMD